MDYIFLLLGSMIVITCFYFIVSPFFNKGEENYSNSGVRETEMPVEMIYAAVNELEMDFLMKKLTQDDFERMKKQYHTLAASYLKSETKQNRIQPKGNRDMDIVDREILKELNKIRKQKKG
ncbi:hypothetical protein ACFFHH_11545 [Cytobacillus solani]|uniref:Uncharacterized protein n=1 Tax=Cytobacillus solani TaxID=1637975 RepID=A0A0Q3QRV0_9BACI|nr:hypothetical protein [Cytobacillus solani]KOP83820.1 hypothetical protein AMS60_15750 [Bacillus sp. FJAT-21945]KQL20897.1 hypothetical protein AN957_21375 [Cytobacillus solani]USK54141.1 hypothetical protein LIS82_21465 [Cytobacillus solani]